MPDVKAIKPFRTYLQKGETCLERVLCKSWGVLLL